MKIILLQDIKNLGKKFDIKDVSDGYARNFLIPKGLAKHATTQTLKEIEKQKLIISKREQELKSQLKKLKEELEKIEIEFKVTIGGKQQMYSSINEIDIQEKIIEKFESSPEFKEILKQSKILLEKPIKRLGDYQVEIDLSQGIKASLKIIVKALSAEAEPSPQ